MQNNHQPNTTMNIKIPSTATTASIKATHPVPRGASHFKFTTPGRKPVVDVIKNLDVLAGCSGKLEYGKVTFEGRGRHAKIKAFTPLTVASASTPEPASAPEVAPEPEPAPVLNAAEVSVVRGVIAEMARQGWDFGYSDNVKVVGLTKHQVAGYLGDLQRKGLVRIQPDGNINFMYANREQMEAIVANAPAPEQAAPTAPTAGRTKGTKLNRILGFSACAVAKALGKAGVKHEEAARIFRAHGIEMPKASLSVQLGFGRNPATWERHGKPAELSDTQIAELRTKGVEQ